MQSAGAASVVRRAGLLLLLAGCGGSRASAPPAAANGPRPAPVTSAPVPLASLYVLGFNEPGVVIADSSMTLPAGTVRRIILRHAAQDLDVFAAVTVNGASFAGPGPVTVQLNPIAGSYGLAITADQPISEPLTVEFRYGRHFSPPPGAIERYQTPIAYERALSVARQLSETDAVLLPSTRRALDFLSAPVPANGRYFVAAPK